WLLSLDADEEITAELADEIRALFASGEPTTASAYILRIRDMLPGETKLVPSAHTNFCIRLYNREKARFSDSAVHDSVIPQDATDVDDEILQAPVLHRSFRSIGHAIDKLNSYSNVQARNLKKLPFPLVRLVIEFPMAFFKVYFIRGYVTRGKRGFAYAMVYAFGRFVRIAKYLDKN
ncbi:MAG: glycosyltransferase family 2 protein, partial [Alphaproteobacteria bacterium]|nr:glycosyltransferase family 2 protein [Alphaproteobacteria bacterium]